MCVEPSGGEALEASVVNDRYSAFAAEVVTALAGGEDRAEVTHVWVMPTDDRCVCVHAEHLHKHISERDARVRLSDVREACRALAHGEWAHTQVQRIPGQGRGGQRLRVYVLDLKRVREAAGVV